jgi:hypothetical protein
MRSNSKRQAVLPSTSALTKRTTTLAFSEDSDQCGNGIGYGLGGVKSCLDTSNYDFDTKLQGKEDLERMIKKQKKRKELKLLVKEDSSSSSNVLSFRGSVMKQENLLLKVYMSQFKKRKA